MPEIDMIASGYEWVCPLCDIVHNEDAPKDEVACSKCDTTFTVGEVHHAYG